MARRKNDFYPTPANATLALLDSCREIHGIVYEPCNGQGHITDVLVKSPRVGVVITADIDPNMRPRADYTLDAIKESPPQLYKGINWVVTNPPFNQAFEIWLNMWGTMNIPRIAFLLRLSFLEPVVKRLYALKMGPQKLIVLPRISFTGDGKTDSVTCAWMVWDAKNDHAQQPDCQTIKVYTKEDLERLQRA